MLLIVKGIILLLFTLGLFSLFSFKAPKGRIAMGGMAGAAVATFLVEAVHKYICGDFLKISFLGETGAASGGMGGPAAAILVATYLRCNPVFAIVAGAAVSGYGILPGFIAGYLVSFIAPQLEKRLPMGVDIIAGALLIAPIARGICYYSNPVIIDALDIIGGTITEATKQSPIVMGFLLGGIIKMICTSPLSSMALTAMLQLKGLPMGIAAIACFGGSFTNGIVFLRMKFGNRSNIISVMLEPLTQADVVTQNPIPIYSANFIGGGLAGMGAAWLGIINDAPGTASPIPGLLAPFAFNSAKDVILALILAAIGGIIAGYVVTQCFIAIKNRKASKKLIEQPA